MREIPKPHSSTFPSRGGLASSRAEGTHQATGEKMVRTWHKDGTEEGRRPSHKTRPAGCFGPDFRYLRAFVQGRLTRSFPRYFEDRSCGFGVSRMQDLSNGDLEKRDSPSPVTVHSEQGDGQDSGSRGSSLNWKWTTLTPIVPALIFCL
ncbi:hypothetical protein CEXT_82441 [Caerostris extrusa]|uniref:Uncharacterized protein n=1 Tax=Caerostris extrusa TaxID=172846 RepID=A0AAV4R087_CAEEX|nr:hypothetical protein CEXT_82441 [Caerostris extrusa]